MDYFRISPTAYFVPVSIKVPGSVVALAAKRGASLTQFDFAGQIQDERHAVVGNVRDNIQIKLDEDSASAAARKNFQYDAGFTLEPGRYHMKFVVRENITGKMGTFETRFTVPDLSADTSGLKLSSIIWSSQREAVASAVGSAARFTRRAMQANPLIVGDQKVIPNITHVFRRSQNLYVNFDVYDALPDPANSESAPHQSRLRAVQRERREDLRSRPAGCRPSGGDASGGGAGAVPGAAQGCAARSVHLPDQRRGRSGPEIRVCAGQTGDSVAYWE